MIERVFWNDDVNAFADALNEIERKRKLRDQHGVEDSEQCKKLETSDIKHAVQELLNALNDAATLRLEVRSVAVRAYREGLIDERDFNALIASANN